MGKKKSVKKVAQGTKPRSKKSKNQKTISEQFSDDEVDAFSSSRDKILLQNYNQYGEDNEDSDSEEAAQPVMDIEGSDSSDSDFMAIEEKEAYERQRQVDIANEEKTSKGWRKKDMYGADTAEYELMDHDEEQYAKDEEVEALRLQQEQSGMFAEDDFGDDLDQITADKDNKKKKITSKKDKKSKKKSKKGKKAVAAATDDLDAMNDELGQVELNLSGGNNIVKLTKDRSNLSKAQQLDIVLTDAPEVFALVEELEGKINEIQHALQPSLQSVQSNDVDTSKGISFLQVKLQLLLSYLTNVTFLLMLRAEGKSIKNHPVVNQLAKLRVVLDKIKPVDKKLKYQVEKLLKLGASGAAQELDEDEEDEEEVEANPLSFKPNPNNLSASSVQPQESGDGLYKISRNNQKIYDDDRIGKRNKKEDKLKARAANSKLVRQLRADLYSDKPEQVEIYGDHLIKGDRDDKEKKNYEEDMFMRLMETKKDKGLCYILYLYYKPSISFVLMRNYPAHMCVCVSLSVL